MNTTRLYVLGLLGRAGPMHGHQIRREAQLDRAEFWGEVQVGALYGALHRMEAEGLIEALRTEQAGNYPNRTVYSITDEGRREFRLLRRTAFEWSPFRPDPFDLALSFSDDMDAAEIRARIEARVTAIEASQANLASQESQASAHLSAIDHLVLEHLGARLAAERAWLGSLLARVDGGSAPWAGPGSRVVAAQRTESGSNG